MPILIVADDLTGANDCLVQFAKRGAKSLAVYDPTADFSKIEYDVLACSSESRGVTPQDAYSKVKALLGEILRSPGAFVYKKMDSAIRGNIGIEIDAMIDCLPNVKAVLVAPAYPVNGRVTKWGRQFINGIPVHESEMANDPITPVAESSIPILLARQSHKKIGYLPIDIIAKGLTDARRKIHELIANNCQIIVADAIFNEHLNTLAKIIDENKGILPCGSAGLAAAFADRMVANPNSRSSAPMNEKPDNRGPFLAVVGSKSDNAHQQVAKVRETLPMIANIEINPLALTDSQDAPATITRIVRTALIALETKHALLLSISSAVTLNPEGAAKIAAGLGEITRLILLQTALGGLFVTGGDIAARVFHRLNAQAVAVKEEIEPGICSGRIIGGSADQLAVVTKAGSFGDAGTLVRIFEKYVSR